MRIGYRWITACLGFIVLASCADVARAALPYWPQDQELSGEQAEEAGATRATILDDPLDFSKEPVLPPIEPVAPEELQRAIDRGVTFLLETQNADGSWGSPDAQRPFQIYAPIPGSHHAFRAAVTALCTSALTEIVLTSGEDADPKIVAAVELAETWLFENLSQVKRATGDAIYNVWSHAYGIQALVRMHERARGNTERQSDIKSRIRQQMEMLDSYESVDGGWGYYDFRYQAHKPTSESTSFVNATVLIAMKEAEQIGVEPNAKTVQRAVEATRRQQKPDFTYLYGEYLKNVPMAGINRPAGSLGRSQVCNVAMRMWGDEKVTQLVLKNWLYRLYVRNGWLSIGRKRPIPHEAWFQVAGYFYYYGHYYAAYAIEELEPSERGPYQDHLAKIIMTYQETDGSWWDYPLYGYHRPYGTAFAIMTLRRCQR